MFQPPLPLRGATTSCSTAQCGSCFNPRSPCGERRCSPSPPRGTARFNPRSPCGERRATEKKRENLGSFQPTLPLRGATTPAPPSPEARVFQPTLPLRGATATGAPARRWSSSFNPRSPCGERRSSRPSTSPSASFNPRSPCGERRWRDLHQALLQRVSTHAPLAGSDGYSCSRPRLSSLFQPTLPLRGATGHGRRRHQEADVSTHAPLAGSDGPHLELLNVVLVVSTHAPLAGSDPRTFRCRSRQACFNPRSPCGERLFGFLLLVCLDEFQPTLPLRGATPWRWHRKSSARVSTHAPLAGSDASTRARSGAVRCFNPRSPCGERLLHLVNVALRAYHMHDVFHPNASSDELRPSEANQKAVRTSQGIPDSPPVRTAHYSDRLFLKRQESLGIVGLLRTNMLYLRSVIISQIIESQAILLRINQLR